MINILNPPTAPVMIGHQGDNNFIPIPIDISGWLLPGCEVSIWYTAPGETEAIPVESGITESPAVWTPRASEMTVPGRAVLQLMQTRDNDLVGMSKIVPLGVPRSIIPIGSDLDRPSWASEMMETVSGDADRAESAALGLEEAVSKTAMMIAANVEQDNLAFYDADGNPVSWDDVDEAEAVGKAIFITIPQLPHLASYGSLTAYLTNFKREEGRLVRFDIIGPCVLNTDAAAGTATGGTFYCPITRDI